ncbi:MAG: hypothetical protein QM767_28090 [Anaeromyxobacter sp.]
MHPSTDDFNSAQRIWREFKDFLFHKVFYRKCAYCERKVSGAHPDAEHYRPKGAVKYKDATGKLSVPSFQTLPIAATVVQDFPHPGYFWLALDWRNLIPACELCNSGLGKNDRFDLPVGKLHLVLVALTPVELANFPPDDLPRESKKWPGHYYLSPHALDEREEPLLLNPTSTIAERDPHKHIRFGVRGIEAAVPGSTIGQRTIEILRLDDGLLREDRQQAQETFQFDYHEALREANIGKLDESKVATLLDEYAAGKYPFSAAALDYYEIMLEREEELRKSRRRI